MRQPLSPGRGWGGVVAAAVLAAAVSGCGSSAARPDPKPVKQSAVPFKPVPPRFPPGPRAGATFVVDLTNVATVRPATLAVASNGTLRQLQWSSWGGSVADGHGTALVRSCTPSCAAGQLASYPVNVTLSSRTSCDGTTFYVDSSVVAETPQGRQREGSFLRNPCESPQP